MNSHISTYVKDKVRTFSFDVSLDKFILHKVWLDWMVVLNEINISQVENLGKNSMSNSSFKRKEEYFEMNMTYIFLIQWAKIYVMNFHDATSNV